MSDAPSTPDPSWPREALYAALHEVRAYLEMTWATLRHPRRFYAEWAAGERRALNPLAATLNAVAVLGVWQIILRNALRVPPPSGSWWEELAMPIIATARYCVFGVACHLAVWIFGARRPLRTTLGAVLLCSAGSLCVMELLVAPIGVTFVPLDEARAHALAPRMLWFAAVGLISAVVTISLLAMAIASAQGRRGWRTSLPVTLTMIAYAAAATWALRHHPALVNYLQ